MEKDYGMLEIWVNDGLEGKMLSLGVAHADCFQRVLMAGQRRFMRYGEESDFEELEAFKEVHE